MDHLVAHSIRKSSFTIPAALQTLNRTQSFGQYPTSSNRIASARSSLNMTATSPKWTPVAVALVGAKCENGSKFERMAQISRSIPSLNKANCPLPCRSRKSSSCGSVLCTSRLEKLQLLSLLWKRQGVNQRSENSYQSNILAKTILRQSLVALDELVPSIPAPQLKHSFFEVVGGIG